MRVSAKYPKRLIGLEPAQASPSNSASAVLARYRSRCRRLYTFSLVLVLAAPGHVGYEAEERGVQILVGIGILVVGLAVVHALGRWLQQRYPQPELAPAGPSA